MVNNELQRRNQNVNLRETSINKKIMFHYRDGSPTRASIEKYHQKVHRDLRNNSLEQKSPISHQKIKLLNEPIKNAMDYSIFLYRCAKILN
jgi:hypothetical protein